MCNVHQCRNLTCAFQRAGYSHFHKITFFLVQCRSFTIRLQRLRHPDFHSFVCFCHCWHPNMWVFMNSPFARFLYLCSISVLKIHHTFHQSEQVIHCWKLFSCAIFHSMHKIHNKNGKLLLLDWPHIIDKDCETLAIWGLFARLF